MSSNHVRPIRRRTKAEVSGALAAGWARVSAGRKGAFADNLEVCTKTIDRALIGETAPELHTAFNSLADDPTALDEVLALYGRRLCPLHSAHDADASTLAEMAQALASYAQALADGRRDHTETMALAILLRRVLPKLTAIVAEADAMRGVPA